MQGRRLIILSFIALGLVVLPAVSAQDKEYRNGVDGLQKRIDKVFSIIKNEATNELEKEDQIAVEDTLKELDVMNTQFSKVGSEVPKEKIEEWTKEVDDILNEYERDGGRVKRSFWSRLRRFVRRVRWWVSVVCYFIRC